LSVLWTIATRQGMGLDMYEALVGRRSVQTTTVIEDSAENLQLSQYLRRRFHNDGAVYIEVVRRLNGTSSLGSVE